MNQFENRRNEIVLSVLNQEVSPNDFVLLNLTLEIRLIGVRVLVSASVVREMTLEFCIIHFIDQKYWKKLHNLIIHHLPLPNYRRKLFFLIKALTFCNLFHVEQIVRKLKVDTPINLDSEFRNIDACIGRKKHVLYYKKPDI